jgi:hypothetical protein
VSWLFTIVPLAYLALSVFLLLMTECASWFPARRAFFTA